MMSNELMHYGVLGMKWGIHKAKQNGTTYEYKSFGQKRAEKKYQKAVNKGKGSEATIQRHKLNVYKQRDRLRQDYATRTSVGANIARNFLMTPIGNGVYNRFRASGQSVFKSAVAGVASNFVLTGGFIASSRMSEMKTANDTAYMPNERYERYGRK